MVSRTRTKKSYGRTPYSEDIFLKDCNAYWQHSDSRQGIGTGEEEIMTDVVTARFSQLSAQGKVVFNPLMQTKRTASFVANGEFILRQGSPAGCSSAPGEHVRYRSLNGASLFIPSESGDINVWPKLYRGLDEADIASALVEVSTSVLNKRGRANNNLFETLAEANQIFDLFDSPIRRTNDALNRAARDLSTGRGTGKASLLASGGYLLYRYGLRPLISDISGIIEGLNKKVGKMRLTSRSGLSMNSSVQVPFSQQPPGKIVSGQGTIYVSDQLDIRGMSLDEADISLGNNLGFTAKGLLTLPYDLVTLSFVADWFANAGDYVGAWAPAFGWNQLGSALVTRRTTINQMIVEKNTCHNAGFVLDAHATGTCMLTSFTKQRQALKAPGLVIRQDFGFDKATRVADALALIHQRLHRLARRLPSS